MCSSDLGCVRCGNRIADNARYYYDGEAGGSLSGCGWVCNVGYHVEGLMSAPVGSWAGALAGGGNSSTWKLVGNSSISPDMQGMCVGGTVVYGGRRYATLDGTDPQSLSNGWQADWLQVPEGWTIAPNTQQTQYLVGLYPFEIGRAHV